MDNENNINENNANVKKQSPYKGIEDPQIRAQYEKEYGMINVRLLVSLILIFVCAVSYLFIISDTFETVKVDKEDKDINVVVEEKKEETDSEEIDITKLTVFDDTMPSNGNFVCDAKYEIENLDYEKSSFRIPYININSEDAKKVNNEIKENFKTWAAESAKYKKKYGDANLNSQSVIKTNYEIYNYQNILSVVICYTYRSNGMLSNDYYSYSFNTTKESILAKTNEELVGLIENENKGTDNVVATNDDNFGKLITYQEILAKLNLSYEIVDTHYKDILKQYSIDSSDASFVDKTLSLYNEQYEKNDLDAFIDNKGNLCMISKIYSSIYEQGTYRMFKFDGEKFDSLSFGIKDDKDEQKEKEKELIGTKN